MSKTRHVAASRGDVIATALREQRVMIWSLAFGTMSKEFDTVLDFGGHRLALPLEGKVCVAGAYHAGGVAAYDTSTGAAVWHRTDVLRCQYLKASLNDQVLYVGIERGPCIVLDAATGAEIERHRSVRRIFESPFEPYMLIDKKNPELRSADGQLIRALQLDKFAINDTTFGPNFVCVAESGGDLRCFDTIAGWEQWRYLPPAGSHVLTIDFSPTHNLIWCVEVPFARWGPKRLVQIDVEGRRLAEFPLGDDADVQSCRLGDCAITSRGTVIDVLSGRVITRLPFP